MRICHDMGVPVVPRGAGTSLAGGALPTADSVVIATLRLREVLEIDTRNRFVRVQTGVTNLSVSGELAPLGFFYAPDPSSQTDEEWEAFLFIRDNTKGPHYERWRHFHGCGRFFNAVRDTVSDRFLTTYKAGEARPDLASLSTSQVLK